MLKLRTILLYNYPYYMILVLVLLISVVRLIIPKESIYNTDSKEAIGIITSYKKTTDKLEITIKNKETLIIYYYIKNNSNKLDIKLGDKIQVTGEFITPSSNTTKHLFNYQKYLYNKNIFYIVNATNIKKLSSSINIYYKIKLFIFNRTNKNPYLKAFILGDKSDINKEAITSYQENGISHLLAISGMHIILLSSIFLNIFKKIKIKEKSRYLYTSILLILYLSLIGLSPSAIRGVLFFILFSINKIYYFHIKPQNIFILVLSITLIINPFFIYDIGFQYSFLISITLILMAPTITGNYLQKLLKTSFLSFLISIPISLYNYCQINLLSIIYNLFYVPYVSFLLFPLSLITLFFKPLLPIYAFLTNILENTSIFLNKLTIGKLIFPKLIIIVYIFYLILVIYFFVSLNQNNKKPVILIIIILILHYICPFLNKHTTLSMIDIGQGDSILLNLQNKNILIDTGGKLDINKKNKSTKIFTTTIPYLKTQGIRKLEYLIITHGDYDHMGEAINLVNNFKVEKVIFNCGNFNELEQDLIKVLDKKKIPYYSCIKELNIDDNKLYFLNTKDYGNENDNSSVIYTQLNNYKFLFMGDAGVKVEEDLIEKYNLKNIDVLKVGHHGSKTSSGKNFINEVNPKYSVISVGKNNRYGHPHDSVLDNLNDSKIYRTDQDGSIMFKIKNNKLELETCPP